MRKWVKGDCDALARDRAVTREQFAHRARAFVIGLGEHVNGSRIGNSTVIVSLHDDFRSSCESRGLCDK